MSRIGKLPISVPSGVDVAIDERLVTVKGPKGTLSHALPPRSRSRRATVCSRSSVPTTSARAARCTG